MYKSEKLETEFRQYLTRRKGAWIHFLESTRTEKPKILRGRVEIVIGEMESFEHEFEREQELKAIAKRERSK